MYFTSCVMKVYGLIFLLTIALKILCSPSGLTFYENHLSKITVLAEGLYMKDLL